VTTLLERTPLRAEALAVLAQCTPEEAQDTLARLERADVVTRLVNRSRAFRLADPVRETLADPRRPGPGRRSRAGRQCARAPGALPHARSQWLSTGAGPPSDPIRR
jgi:hypothetical protein